jgi:hypothetical protein
MASASSNGVPKNADPIWWYRHDIFNICALPMVCISNISMLLGCKHNDLSCDKFVLLYYVFLTYIVIDTLWISFIPKSVPAPILIVVHHLVCICGWQVPFIVGTQWADISVKLLLVEINTWLLMVRRHLDKNTLAYSIVNFLFGATWICIRNIYYPMVTFDAISRYIAISEVGGSYFNRSLIPIALLLFLNFLNVKWTVDLAKTLFPDKSEKAIS